MHSCFASVFNERRTTMTNTGIQFHRTTTLTPEQYIAGLTDFGPGRAKLFANSADAITAIYGTQTNACSTVFESCQRPATTPRALIPYAAEPKNDPGTAICPGTSKTTAFPFA